MRIFVKTLTGKTIIVDIDADATIEDLKNGFKSKKKKNFNKFEWKLNKNIKIMNLIVIEDKEGIDPNQQRYHRRIFF